MTSNESVLAFLRARPHNGPDLISRLTSTLEYQVNVAQGDGYPVEGKRFTFSDGVNEWHNLRIADAKRAGWKLKYPLELHAIEIGSTGWDWSAQRSRFVGFDFDSIAGGHAAGVGISDAELGRVKEAACAIPWIEVRRSTGGNGLHLYVMFDSEGVSTENRTVHAVLGRAVLGLMTERTGYNFAAAVDCAGSNMWMWSRRSSPENQGLALVKAASEVLSEADIPAGWRSTLTKEASTEYAGNELTEDHWADIKVMREAGFVAEWDGTCLQCHTKGFEALRRGNYRTTSPAREPKSPNARAFPQLDGGWIIVRYKTEPKSEAPGWMASAGGAAMYRLPAAMDWGPTSVSEPVRESKLPIFSAADLMNDFQQPRPNVIEGLAQQGDVINVIASPKMHKSFFGEQLLLSAAHGLPFLGRATVKGRALLVDVELKRDTLSQRLRSMAEAMGIDEVRNLDVMPLRGSLVDLKMLRDELIATAGKYKLVVFDALYKLLRDCDENSNSDMAAVYSLLDEIAEKHGCALVVIHHASKGAQHAKSVSDMGSGAGAQSRSADCHIVLRQHEDPDCAVMQAVIRSQKPIEPTVLKFVYPLWQVAEGKSPNTLAIAGKKPLPTLDDFLALMPSAPEPRTTTLERARQVLGCTRLAVQALLDAAVADGLVEIGERKNKNQPYTIRRLSPKVEGGLAPTLSPHH